MLVSHRRRFIYTKTHKTAGTSVESYFEPYCMPEGQWAQVHLREEHISSAGIIGARLAEIPEGCLWWHHMPAARIRKQLGEEIWNSYFKFCVVRNPYDKAVSEFFFRKARGIIAAAPNQADAESFEQWLAASGPTNDRAKYLIKDQFCLDDVIRYESLADDLQRVCSRLDVAWEPARLPEFKKGIRPSGIVLADFYTEKAKELVRAAYEFEFSHFGYSFPD
jgi:hypothetical protein